MTYTNTKRQRLTAKSNNVCTIQSDSQSKQVSIRSFCIQRKAKQSPQTPPTPFPRSHIATPPTENSRHQATPPSPVSPPPRSSKANHKKKHLAQVFLDCGQKNWGQVICDKCGTLYVPGVPEDMKMHNQVCTPISLGVPWHSTSNCKVLPNLQQGQFRILMIRPSDYKNHKGKLQKIKKIVEKDLGMKSCSNPVASIFLCIHNTRVVGFLSVEAASIAYQMLNLYERGKTHKECLLGVAVIWTHSKFRHQGKFLLIEDRSKRVLRRSNSHNRLQRNCHTVDRCGEG